MSVPILTQIERLSRAVINPLIVPAYDGRNPDTYPKTIVGTLYTFICWLNVTLFMNYIVQVFPIQSWGRCTAAWGSYFYAPNIFLVVVWLVLMLLEKAAPKKSSKKTA